MHKEDIHKKLQNTLEFIVIVSFIAIVALSATILYIKNITNVKLGNTDTLLAGAYVTGANGQPICNASEGESSCFEILLSQPLPKYPTYSLSYWNEKDPSGNYAFELEQDNYVICVTSPVSNQFNGYPTICDTLDNYDDVNYIGQVDGYYEYIMNAGGIPVKQPAFLSDLELYYYTPNLNGNLANTTYILSPSGGVLPLEMDLNTTSLTNLVPEQTTQVPKLSDVLTVTEAGLQSGSTLSYTETFPNGTVTSGNFIVPSNSENTFVISNLTNQLPEIVTLSLTGITNGVTVGKETLTTSDNNNVFINFTPPAPIELISTTSTVGPFVVTTNRDEQFSNMVVTTGNTLSNGGITDDAYITNITSDHVEFFIKTPANVIYLNFEGASQLSPNGPTGEAPYLDLNAPNYAPYDDGPIVFDGNYTNFITANPSSGIFGSNTPSTQNDIITNVFSSGPFTFNANGNQTMSFTIDDGLTTSTIPGGNGYNENLYLPIQEGETYILGGQYDIASTNIGVSNSTDNYYDNGKNDPMWTNGVFDRGAVNGIYFVYLINSSNSNPFPGGQNEEVYNNYETPLTYSTYSLNQNDVTITFPDGQVNKQFTKPLEGSYSFTMESFNNIGPFYYLAETNQPVQLELCNAYSAPNTISCST